MLVERDYSGDFEFDLLARMPQATQLVMDNARKEAERLGHQRIQTPHVLLGLLADPQLGGLFYTTGGEQLDPEKLRERVSMLIGKGDYTGGNLVYSSAVRRLVRSVYGQALSDNRAAVMPQDLLRAILSDEGSLASNVLRYAHVDIAAVQQSLGTTPPHVA